MQQTNKGFTLVELSIVLVIIGLLIGGILTAQSMIETTNVQSQIRQLQQLDIAVTNFATAYKGIPGDCSKISGNGFQGDDNGILSPDGSTTPNGAELREEIGNFFPTLIASGNLNANDLKASITNNTDRQNAGSTWPLSPFNSAIVPNSSPQGGLFWEIYLPPGLGFFGESPNFGPFTASEALAIDTKIDDGIGNTGDVIAPIYNVGGYNPWPGTPPYNTYYSMQIGTQNFDWCLKANSGTYNTASGASACGLNIKSKATLP